jgi:hypothetical protein
MEGSQKHDASNKEDNDRRYHNVLLQGQFNFETSGDLVEGWVEAYSKYFSNVIVVGPFSQKTQAELKEKKVSFRIGREDKGMISPYENLMTTLLEFKSHPVIQGVLSVHDDALLNLTDFANGTYPFPTDDIIGTFKTQKEIDDYWTYSISATKTGRWKRKDEIIEVIYSRGSHQFKSIDEFRGNVSGGGWMRFGSCLSAHTEMLLDPDFFNAYGSSQRASLETPGQGQSDVLFVPTKHADAFVHEARPHVAHKVFLECAVPTIVHRLVSNASAVSRRVALCTTFDLRIRTKNETLMISNCLKRRNYTGNGYGVYHPFKIGKSGVENWTEMLHLIQ